MRFLTLSTFALLLAASHTMAADLVMGSGTWLNLSDISINRNGTPYWDNPSNDPGNRNIGHFVTGNDPLHNSALTSAPATQYYANADNSQPIGFTFASPGGQWQGSFLLEVAAFAPINTLGYYKAGDPKQATVLYNGAATPNPAQSIAFNPKDSFGLFLTTLAGLTYYSESNLNHPLFQNDQQFALFRATQNLFYVGAEDVFPNYLTKEKRGDFNDMVVRLSYTPANDGPPVPEPGTYALVGGGLAATAFLRRRK